MANLQRHIGLLDLDAVIFSHEHPDHFLDLYPYFYARLFHPENPAPLPLFAPPGAFGRARSLVSDSGRVNMGRAFDVREVDPGDDIQIGPFRILTAPMRHPVPTLGMRFEADGATLAYSADTGPTEALVSLSRGADVLMSEATWLEAPQEVEPLHLTGREAGEHAARAGVGTLLLTHIWPTFDHEEVADRARETFQGPVVLAREGLEVDL
jgi:ribonuclease BN (tRNA processing enzyme)